MAAQEEREHKEGSGHGSIAVRAIFPPWLDESTLYTQFLWVMQAWGSGVSTEHKTRDEKTD